MTSAGTECPARLVAPLPASIVYDAMKARGLENCVLPSEIRPLAPGSHVCGRAFSIEGSEVDSLTADETLLRWSELLSRIPAGTVAVCQPHTKAIALMGELSARALAIKGVHGYIADGGCRDAQLVEESGFPVFCTHLTPRDIVGRWTWCRLGQPIIIGGVAIASGDLVVADRDGVVVVPAGIAENVRTEALALLTTESDMRRDILSGMDPEEAYLLHRKF